MSEDDLMAGDRKIVRAAIYPGIGIARVGNSPDEYFIGPEAPLQVANAGGPFKDEAGRVKRQAARFRLYGYDAKGNVVGEITADDASIEWHVHLANKKGSWYLFQGKYLPTKKLRNPTVQPDLDPDARTELIVDPGSRSIRGRDQSGVRFDGGRFLGTEVPLGELRTDGQGRLVVLGGLGAAASVKTPPNPITQDTEFAYFNTPWWYDDTSDGPVTAKVTLKTGEAIDVEGAWVLVTPPKYAPHIYNAVSLFDVVSEASASAGEPGDVVFYRDIYPILERAARYAWVNNNATRGHGPGKGGNLIEPRYLKQLESNAAKSKIARQRLFDRIRVPERLSDEATRRTQANMYYMPQLWGDGGHPTAEDENDWRNWLTLTAAQYAKLEQWAKGKFTVGTRERYVPLEEIDNQDQPAALDRAALEPCVGGGFHPGIEMTYIAADPATYSGPFRLAKKTAPGDISRIMAVPWQGDFWSCNTAWWPAQRPDDVVPEQEYRRVVASWGGRVPQPDEKSETSDVLAAALGYHAAWSRGLHNTVPRGYNDMVKYWSELGFVVRRDGPDGEPVFIEQERAPYAGMEERALFYALQNVDHHPDVLPKAREFVERGLAWARAFAEKDDTPDLWKPFVYTEKAFEARMMESYNVFVDEAAACDPATDPLFRTRADVIQRIIQLTPFDITDGAWLRNINSAGPEDEVRALLFSILMDERGDGDPSMNHCNIYRDLCHDVGFYPKPVDSRAFAYDPVFLDSAFTIPTFELAISQFSESYYPEIIGMTLQLEWSVVELKPTIELLEYFDMNPHFYVMHVGIDNAVNGHGRRVMDAVGIYLDNVREVGGEEAVQEHWQRIWNGYVAFGNLGTLGNDLKEAIENKPSLHQQMVALIKRKAPFGSLNHQEHMLGPNRINDWFTDPDGFLQELIKAGYVIPGDPDNSRFFALLDFETGPMYRVFTPDEIKLWQDWIRSLTDEPRPPAPTNPATDMMRLIRALKEQQSGSVEHRNITLKAPDHDDAHPVSWWFTQPPEAFMAALADPANGWIVPGSPDESPFLTKLLSEGNEMGKAFEGVIPGTGKTGKEIAVRWIKSKCPVPPVRPTERKKLWLTSSLRTREEHPTGAIQGMGTIH